MDVWVIVILFKEAEETRPHFVTSVFLIQGELSRRTTNVYNPVRPTTIKGKFTVGKGKYVNKVYCSSNTRHSKPTLTR